MVLPGDSDEQTNRESCLDVVHKLYPGITLSNDSDILFLSGGQYKGPLTNEAAHEWLDAHVAGQLSVNRFKDFSKSAARAQLLEEVTNHLDSPARVIGVR